MSSDPRHARVREAAGVVAAAGGAPPAIGLVLGSGLGEVADGVQVAHAFDYAALPHFAPTGVGGHAGRLLVGRLAGVPVAVLVGRVHAYEGHSLAQVTFGVRVLAALGCRILVQTNAAGGVDRRLAAGSLMAIVDHLNLTAQSPLVGPHDPLLGPRFLDMTYAYSPRLLAQWRAAAAASGVHLDEGIYAGVGGPSYETPAEVRLLATIGAQAVGMSTVHETLVARHAGLEVAALSVITNAAAGYTQNALSHAEVTLAGQSAAARVAILLDAYLPRIAALPPAA